jgi:periplasmic protein TonB
MKRPVGFVQLSPTNSLDQTVLTFMVIVLHVAFIGVLLRHSNPLTNPLIYPELSPESSPLTIRWLEPSATLITQNTSKAMPATAAQKTNSKPDLARSVKQKTVSDAPLVIAKTSLPVTRSVSPAATDSVEWAREPLAAATQPENASTAPTSGAATPSIAVDALPRELPSSVVAYLVPPTLVYPAISTEKGETGEVLLHVLIDEAGRPHQIKIKRSSGYVRLDQAAVAALQTARFKPPVQNGQTVSGYATVPLVYRLED